MPEMAPTLPEQGIFPTLKDPVAQAHFERDGIVVVPMLEPGEARELRRRIVQALPADPGPFFDPFRNPPELRKRIDSLIRGELEERVGEIFVDHDFWSATVLVKQPGEEGEVGLHTDWNMVDESRYRSGLIWLALDDTSARNGGLLAVPGTNRLDVPYRGKDVHFGFDTAPVQARIDAQTVAVDVTIGHAAVWDNRLLHGSGPNTADDWRIVAALGFKPRQGQLYHYRLMPDGVTHRFAVEREFFLDYEPFLPNEVIDGPHVLADEPFAPSTWELTADDLAGLVAPPSDPGPDSGATSRRWWRRPVRS